MFLRQRKKYWRQPPGEQRLGRAMGQGSPEKEREGGGIAGKQLRNDGDRWPVGVGVMGTAAFRREWVQIQVN